MALFLILHGAFPFSSYSNIKGILVLQTQICEGLNDLLEEWLQVQRHQAAKVHIHVQ